MKTRTRRRKKGPARPAPTFRVWLNQSKPGVGKIVHIYKSKNHLLAELMQAAADGERCFVASNSKAMVNRIEAALAKEFPGTKLLKITADTRPGKEQRAFLNSPATEAALYRVILTSPAVGTGVDISFPDGAQKIDLVFGYFEPLIVNHFDIDQQIGRVRNPGAVKVWIDPRRFAFETDIEVVTRDLLQKALFKDLLVDRDGPGGTARYTPDDAFIEMAAQIIARDRASKNDLLRHFIEHKREQGFAVVIVAADKLMSPEGGRMLALGTQLDDESFARNIMAAAPLRRQEFDRADAAVKADEAVEERLRWSLARTRLELFYREPATPELITADDRSRYRKRVLAFKGVLESNSRGRDGDATPIARDRRYLRSDGAAAAGLARWLRLTPLLTSGGFDETAVIDGDQLAAFSHFAVDNKPELETQLGLEVRKDVAKKPMSQLKAALRHIGLDLVKAGTAKVAGRKIYRYRLDAGRLPRAKAVLAARDRTPAWQFMAELHAWAVDEGHEAELDHEFHDDA